MNDAKKVNMHLGFSEHVKSLHDLFMGRLLALGHPVVIVQLARAVET